MKGSAFPYSLGAAFLLLAAASQLAHREGVQEAVAPPLLWGTAGLMALFTLAAAQTQRTLLALFLPGATLAAAWGLEVPAASWGLPLLFLLWLFFLVGRPSLAALLQLTLVTAILPLSPSRIPETADALQAWALDRFPRLASLMESPAPYGGFIFSGPWLDLEGPFRPGRQVLFEVAVRGKEPLSVLYLYTGIRSYYDGRRWQEDPVPLFLHVPTGTTTVEFQLKPRVPLPTTPLPGPYRKGGEAVAVSTVFTHPSQSLIDRGRQLPDLPPELVDLALKLGKDVPWDAQSLSLRVMTYLRTLQYDLNPPAPPRGEDFVTYFLLESQRGYCTAFASAMAVLLRMEGIPTLLAEGYRVPLGPPDEDGWQHGVVTASMAHTWVLVYDREERHWRRYDPTPGLGDVLPGEGETAASPAVEELRPLPLAPALGEAAPPAAPGDDPVASSPLPEAVATTPPAPVDPQTFSLELAFVLFLLLAAAAAGTMIFRRPSWTWPQLGEYTLQGLTLLGIRRQPGETLARLLRRTADHYPEIAGALLTLEEGWQAWLFGAPSHPPAPPSPELVEAFRRFFRRQLGFMREEALYLDRPYEEAAPS